MRTRDHRRCGWLIGVPSGGEEAGKCHQQRNASGHVVSSQFLGGSVVEGFATGIFCPSRMLSKRHRIQRERDFGETRPVVRRRSSWPFGRTIVTAGGLTPTTSNVQVDPIVPID